MLDFKIPQTEDKLRYQNALEKTNFEGCDIAFATTIIWGEHYNVKTAYKNGFVFKSYYRNNYLSGYVMPFGGEYIKWAIDEIFADAKERGIIEPLIGLLTDETKALLERLYPGRFRYIEMRSDADYIYSRDDLAYLKGRRYHSKRNHISQFKKMYPDYEYRPITPELFDDALKVAKLWCEKKRQNDPENFMDDYALVKKAIDNFFELELMGGVLYIGNSPVAMTLASKIRGNICDVHFEKAVDEHAYTVICNEFAKSISDFDYINREEDMGIEGLRKSKLSYRPQKILMKYAALETVPK